MRAVVLDEQGQPRLAEVAEPEGAGTLARVVACGLCGSDVEKLGREPAGTLLVFADAGPLDTAGVYHRELTVHGSRSATPIHMEEAAALLPELDVPEPTVLPLERFGEGLDLYRRGEALKVVFIP